MNELYFHRNPPGLMQPVEPSKKRKPQATKGAPRPTAPPEDNNPVLIWYPDRDTPGKVNPPPSNNPRKRVIIGK